MKIQLLLLGISLIPPVLFWIFSPILSRALFSDLRILRILHYITLAGLGTVLYLRKTDWSLYILAKSLLVLSLFAIALIYAAVFAIVTNNIEDLEADKISNPERPLVQKKVMEKEYFRAGLFCQFYALLWSFLVQKEMFWGVLAISAGYYVYSCKPFRLKRFPFIAKLIIGFNSLAVAVCGYTLAGGAFHEFPAIWVFFILIPLSLAANFVDLKDTAGDGQTGIRTLPVLWGERNARLFIVCCTVFSYAMAAFLLRIIWLYPLIALLSVLHIWFLYKKPYHEKPVFMIYVTGLLSLDICLFFSTQIF